MNKETSITFNDKISNFKILGQKQKAKLQHFWTLKFIK